MKLSSHTLCMNESLDDKKKTNPYILLTNVYNLNLSATNQIAYFNFLEIMPKEKRGQLSKELETLKKKARGIRDFNNKFFPLTSSLKGYEWQLYRDSEGFIYVFLVESSYVKTDFFKLFMNAKEIVYDFIDDINRGCFLSCEYRLKDLIEGNNGIDIREAKKDSIDGDDESSFREQSIIPDIEENWIKQVPDYERRYDKAKKLFIVKIFVILSLGFAFVLSVLDMAFNNEHTIFSLIRKHHPHI